MIFKKTFLAAAAMLVAFSGASFAQAPVSFAGKTITLFISSDNAGGYDSYSRLLARHIGRYIPGNPTVIPQNMPGGGGLRVAQYIYSVAEKDGTKVGNLRPSNMLDAVLGIRGGEIDPEKFEWIGNMSSDTDTCSFWHTAGVKTFEDLRNKEVLVGASGQGAQNYSFPKAINYVLGTKMKIILGYQGMNDRMLAVERGELQGNCGVNAASLVALQKKFVDSGELIPVIQSGTHPFPLLKSVPLTQSYAKTDEQRTLLLAIFSQMDIARIFALPPGTPKNIVETFRTAFNAAMQDKTLIAEAQKQTLDLDALDGSGVAKVVAQMAGLSPELKKKAREAIGE
jgi:tripartite-type tricarboxylate transporter receptor subunit TctC